MLLLLGIVQRRDTLTDSVTQAEFIQTCEHLFATDKFEEDASEGPDVTLKTNLALMLLVGHVSVGSCDLRVQHMIHAVKFLRHAKVNDFEHILIF